MQPDESAILPTAAPARLSRAGRKSIFTYLGFLILLMSLGSPHGGLIDIPLSFLLKNKLHLEATELAAFRLVAAAPLYVSFLFGLVRDTWSPLGLGDRGYLLIFGGACAVLYLGLASVPVTAGTLLCGTILLTMAFLFVSSAQNGLTSLIGQQHRMTGQMSAAWNVFASLPTVVALLAGGALSDWLEGHTAERAALLLFGFGAAVSAMIALYGLWRPAAVFDSIRSERPARPDLRRDLRRLAAHRPIYPALAIWLLWNFAPGSVTPLQYYLQNTLGAHDAAWGQWNAIFAAAFVPTFLLFGWLCQRVRLKTLLFWGTVVAVPQLVPLLFIGSTSAALWAAAASGLMGGVATAAYTDLIMRACPHGLQGTMLMLSGSAYFLASRFGDVLGTLLYARFGGFTVCVAAITIAYALILPLLRLVPPELVAEPDRPVTA